MCARPPGNNEPGAFPWERSPGQLPEHSIGLLCDCQAPQHCDDGIGLHSFAKFQIDLPRLHFAIPTNDKFCRHWQEIALVPVIFFQLDANVSVQFLNLRADPKDKPERQRITEVDITKDGKGQIITHDIVFGEPSAIWHYRYYTSSQSLNFIIDRSKRAQLKFAVRTPVATINADNNRSGSNK